MPISYDLVLKFSTVFISLTENRQYKFANLNNDFKNL